MASIQYQPLLLRAHSSFEDCSTNVLYFYSKKIQSRITVSFGCHVSLVSLNSTENSSLTSLNLKFFEDWRPIMWFYQMWLFFHLFSFARFWSLWTWCNKYCMYFSVTCFVYTVLYKICYCMLLMSLLCNGPYSIIFPLVFYISRLTPFYFVLFCFVCLCFCCENTVMNLLGHISSTHVQSFSYGSRFQNFYGCDPQWEICSPKKNNNNKESSP